jgi:hypothetical protein
MGIIFFVYLVVIIGAPLMMMIAFWRIMRAHESNAEGMGELSARWTCDRVRALRGEGSVADTMSTACAP